MWTIQGQAGKAMDATARTLAAVGAENPRVTFRNMGADALEYEVTLADLTVTTELIPEAGQTVTLLRNGTRFFHGVVAPTRQRGRSVTVTVYGPWWWMERIYLESTRTDETAATAERATFALPKQSLTTSLNSLLTAAIAKGVPAAVGTLATTFTAPEIRLNQMSFAQAVAEVLRLTPDAVLWWDYTASPPTANTVRRKSGLAAGSAASADINGEVAVAFEVNPRVELQVQQVKVPYLERAANGAKKFAVQAAGTAAAGGVQVVTVSGEEMDTFLPPDSLESVTVRTQPLASAGLENLDPTISAMAAKYGSLRSPSGAGVYQEFVYYTGLDTNKLRQVAVFPPMVVKTRTGAAVSPTLSNLLVSADPLPDWAVAQLGAVEVEITATYVAWEISGTLGWSQLFAALREGAQTGGPYWITPYKADTDKYYYLGRAIRVSGYVMATAYTTATTIYRERDFDFVSPPAGFADGLLQAQNYVIHEGFVELMEEECGGARYMNKAINLTGAQAGFATMRAMPESEELELATGTTRINLGTPARYSYADLVNRIRGNPNNNIVYV